MCMHGVSQPNLVTYPLYFLHARTHPEDVCHSKGSICVHKCQLHLLVMHLSMLGPYPPVRAMWGFDTL